MGKKVRSARGVMVDFDLLKIKMQIAESPTVDVSSREAFVERRLRRRTQRLKTPVAPIKIEEPTVDEPDEFAAPPEEELTEPTTRPARKVK